MLNDKNTKVKSLWRYPVKSLLGEELQEIRVDVRGFEGDREFAVMNAQGRLGSGKNTRRFVQIDNLLSLSSRKEGKQFVVELPSGGSLPVLSGPLDDQLSEYLGQKVTIERESKVPHFDDGSVHIITTGGLSSLEKMINFFGLKCSKVCLTNSFPNEPVPPVIRITLPSKHCILLLPLVLN